MKKEHENREKELLHTLRRARHLGISRVYFNFEPPQRVKDIYSVRSSAKIMRLLGHKGWTIRL